MLLCHSLLPPDLRHAITYEHYDDEITLTLLITPLPRHTPEGLPADAVT